MCYLTGVVRRPNMPQAQLICFSYERGSDLVRIQAIVDDAIQVAAATRYDPPEYGSAACETCVLWDDPITDENAPQRTTTLSRCCRGSTTGPLSHQFPSMTDPINNPGHYNSGDIECIEAIKAAMNTDEYFGYLRGNCIKYIWRLPSEKRLRGSPQG